MRMFSKDAAQPFFGFPLDWDQILKERFFLPVKRRPILEKRSVPYTGI